MDVDTEVSVSDCSQVSLKIYASIVSEYAKHLLWSSPIYTIVSDRERKHVSDNLTPFLRRIIFCLFVAVQICHTLWLLTLLRRTRLANSYIRRILSSNGVMGRCLASTKASEIKGQECCCERIEKHYVILPLICYSSTSIYFLRCVNYYAALLSRRGPHIASHSVCPSVRPSLYRYRASRRAT